MNQPHSAVFKCSHAYEICVLMYTCIRDLCSNVHMHTRSVFKCTHAYEICVQMYTCIRDLCSNVHMHTRSVIQGQRGILHSRFRIKHFICSQCDRNYIFSVLIKSKQQINSCKTQFTDANITILELAPLIGYSMFRFM